MSKIIIDRDRPLGARWQAVLTKIYRVKRDLSVVGNSLSLYGSTILTEKQEGDMNREPNRMYKKKVNKGKSFRKVLNFRIAYPHKLYLNASPSKAGPSK